MNTRIRQTLASIFAAAAVMFAVPLAASAQENRVSPVVVVVQRDAAHGRYVRETLRAAHVTRQTTLGHTVAVIPRVHVRPVDVRRGAVLRGARR